MLLLREVRVLSVDARRVQILASLWAAQRLRLQAWSDIEVLAARFLRADPADADDAADRWHHLLMAVGNLKRSAGLIVPKPLAIAPAGDRPNRIIIPGAPARKSEVLCCDPPTWRWLTDIPGLQVPTATTLLSALWPGYHVIIDRADADVAVALDAASILVRERLDSDGWLPRYTTGAYWDLYEWFRRVVVTTADALAAAGSPICPVDVERALFQLALTKKPKDHRGSWKWSDYHEALLRELHST